MSANQVVYKDGYKVSVKMWNSNVPMESGVFDQAGKIAQLPFIFKHVALMPDAHVGIGATVGSVIATKGAIRARKGELGIIPGSMGTRSYIVRGLGNQESFCSCSHGAGRVMSRGKAKELISLAEHEEATKGVMCRKDAGVLDESPKAYKQIDDVMKSQEDLVEVVHTLKQVLCIKG